LFNLPACLDNRYNSLDFYASLSPHSHNDLPSLLQRYTPMFRITIIVLLISSLLAQSMSRGIIVLSYLTNTRAYQEKCVNKAKPGLHCNGKCQMAKKIQHEEAKEQKDPFKSFKFSELSLINQNSFFHIQPLLLFNTFKHEFPRLSAGNLLDRSRTLFRPPDAV
jgi:hypothetical protein